MSDCEAKGQEIIGPVVGADAVTPCPPLPIWLDDENAVSGAPKLLAGIEEHLSKAKEWGRRFVEGGSP